MPGRSEPGGPKPAVRRTDRVVAKVAQTRARVEATRAGHVQRRLVQADLANQGMILAALALTLLLPVLVTLAAVLPLGGSASLPAAISVRLGLSAAATNDLQKLFPTPAGVRGSSTVLGSVFTLISAYAWPAALQRGYEIAWGVTSRGWRGLWRPFVWLTAFVAVGAVLLELPSSPVIPQPWRALLILLLGAPIVFAWSWWTQRFLLSGAVGWRPLLPGAVAMTIGLLALRGAAALYGSAAIISNYRQYGPLGIVFMLLTWLLALSVIMLGGPVVGAALSEHRTHSMAAQTASSESESANQEGATAQHVPAPRAQGATALDPPPDP
jgi:membrane protein